MLRKTHFSHSDTGVWVLDSGNAAVGVEADQWLFLDIRILHELGLVRDTELFKDDGDLPWVWALKRMLDGFLLSMEMKYLPTSRSKERLVASF